MSTSLLHKFSLPTIPLLLVVLLSVFYGSFLTHPINLYTADLGRHIQNGKITLETWHVPATNLYSYTEPNFATIAHHWGSGVVFYVLWVVGGFTLVEMFFILFSLLTFLIFFYLAVQRAGWSIATLVALPIIPLLAERTEIRPEVFSYFFIGVFFLLLWLWQRSKLNWKWLWVLPALEIVWVNTHIYFFLGPLFITAFLFQKKLDGRLLLIFVATSLATFLNPFGYKAVIEPLFILQEYGYRVAENQPVLFIENLVKNPNFLIFKIVFIVFILSFCYRIWKHRSFISFAEILLSMGFSAMAWLQIRNFTIFGLFALVIIAGNFSSTKLNSPSSPEAGLEEKKHIKSFGTLVKIDLAILLIGLIILLSGNFQVIFPGWQQPGLGLRPNSAKAADFFLTNNLSGPIFNNYDIGGYLIFYLYPKEKVFVDNRPEAYSVSFFQDIYVPMQEREEVWEQQLLIHDFNSIVFSHRDATPWGQKFLIQRIQDDQWAPVYADDQAIIFLHRTGKNQKLIEKFEMPKSNFQIISSTP